MYMPVNLPTTRPFKTVQTRAGPVQGRPRGFQSMTRGVYICSVLGSLGIGWWLPDRDERVTFHHHRPPSPVTMLICLVVNVYVHTPCRSKKSCEPRQVYYVAYRDHRGSGDGFPIATSASRSTTNRPPSPVTMLICLVVNVYANNLPTLAARRRALGYQGWLPDRDERVTFHHPIHPMP